MASASCARSVPGSLSCPVEEGEAHLSFASFAIRIAGLWPSEAAPVEAAPAEAADCAECAECECADCAECAECAEDTEFWPGGEGGEVGFGFRPCSGRMCVRDSRCGRSGKEESGCCIWVVMCGGGWEGLDVLGI